MPRLKKAKRASGAGKRDIIRYATVGRDARVAQNKARGGIVSATLLRMFYIVHFYDTVGRMPNAAQLAQMSGGASDSSMRSSIAKLARAGYLGKAGKGYVIAKRPDPALLSRRDRAKLDTLIASAAARLNGKVSDAVSASALDTQLLHDAVAALAPFAAYAETHTAADDKTVPILMARDHIRLEDMRAALVVHDKLMHVLSESAPDKTEQGPKDAADPDLMSFL